MSISIRNFGSNDLSQLQRLMSELGYPLEQNELAKNVMEVEKRAGQIFLAEENEKILGSICVIIDARLAEGIYAEIVSLVVDSNARGRGIGRALVEYAESWAIKFVDRIRVRANEVRREAHSFYEALGYECNKNQKIYRKIV